MQIQTTAEIAAQKIAEPPVEVLPPLAVLIRLTPAIAVRITDTRGDDAVRLN